MSVEHISKETSASQLQFEHMNGIGKKSTLQNVQNFRMLQATNSLHQACAENVMRQLTVLAVRACVLVRTATCGTYAVVATK